MSFLDYFKTAFELAKKAQSVELQGELLSMREDYNTLHEKYNAARARIRELEERLRLQGEIVYESPSYFLRKPDDTRDGPFCQRCWDVDGKLVRTHQREAAGGTLRECNACKSEGWVTRLSARELYARM